MKYLRTSAIAFALLLALTLVGMADAPRGSSSTGTLTVTIAQDASLSAALNLNHATPVQLQMPAAWDAANITFQCSYDNSTFTDLYDQYGTEYSVTAAASRSVILTPADFTGCRYMKVRSGTASVPVAQTAARSLILLMKAF